MEELLGTTLLSSGGDEVSCKDALDDKRAVGLYFSAHWCPPCRGFTPKLAKQYTEYYKEKGLEIVFVSSDRDQASFDSYFGEQPWLALPFSAREAKERLNRRFKVQGIPTLVIVDPATGKLINANGREAVSKDLKGERLPWHPPTKAEKAATLRSALGDELITRAAGKPIGLYFSAHWCPPCRQFTPKLAKLYEDGLKDKLEIVFVSSDRDVKSFEEYRAEMPWPALPFDDRDAKAALSEACGVEGIPTLAVIDTAGNIITTEGRAKVDEDPTGATIAAGGWAPQPFNDVNGSPGPLNEQQCVIALGNDDMAAAAVKEVAAEHFEAAGRDVDDMEIAFFRGPDGRIADQIRRLTKTQDAGNVLILLDIPDSGAFYVHEGAGTGIDAGEVKSFLRTVKGGGLEKRTLSRG